METGIIRFPNLGFEVTVGREFSLFGFKIAYYGVTIAIAMVCGALIAYHEAKRTGQKVDDYIDYTIFGIVGGIVCARIYYVIFQWDQYKDDLLQIFNLRAGGLAIYGGIIGALIAAVIVCRVKKMKLTRFLDTAVLGLILGQIIGRWGNFFNREAFGTYTNNLFAMQIPVGEVSVANEITDAMLVTVNGATFVQVHPTFLYESMGNLLILILLLIFRDKKKFYGETFCRYLIGYGFLRFWIEGLRTDQLQLGNGIPVSRLLSAVLCVGTLIFVIIMRIRLHGKPSLVVPVPKKAGKGAKAPEEAAKEQIEEADEFMEEEDSDVMDTAESVKAEADFEKDASETEPSDSDGNEETDR